MTISTIRRADDDDIAAVRAAAIKFCERHNIKYENDDALSGPEDAIRCEIECGGPQFSQNSRIRRLWTACYCRALRVPIDARTTIAYGHVGIRL